MEIMNHGFGFYIPHIPLIYLLIPLAHAKMWAPYHNTAAHSKLPSTLYFTLGSHRFLPPMPTTDLQTSPSSHIPTPPTDSKEQHTLQLIENNIHAGMQGPMGQNPIIPRTHSVQVVPNPPTLPTFLRSASFMHLLIIIVVIGIWGSLLSINLGWTWSTGSKALEGRHTVKLHDKNSS